MIILLPIHIIGGLVGLAAGAVAMWARKGGPLHRQSGLIFVYGMLGLSISGAIMGVFNGQPGNVIAGTFTLYLVLTALFTVRRPSWKPKLVEVGTLLLGLTVAIVAIGFGLVAGEDDLPAMGFVFGTLALLCVVGDVRRLLTRRLSETQRLLRHLWRMSFALFIAAGSFFLGQADVFPEPIRIMPLLALPVFLVLGLMIFWLVRVRFTRWRPRLAN